ncbi:general stress protein [Nocardia sp. NPDC088792]|uniref:general stress protein n=1 Tax=Nocardia sp. NPDC088792 TaxID=3364332 RepID=UPI003817AB9D
MSTTSAPHRPPAIPRLPTQPSGWPIGSYPTYAEAERAVEYLSRKEFPVEDVTIVGRDLIQVERILGRLTWSKVLAGGVMSGIWVGVFVGLLLGMLAHVFLAPLVLGLTMGITFGLMRTALPYSAAKGKRDFSSAMQIVAGHYDVLCQPTTAERARDLLAVLAIV